MGFAFAQQPFVAVLNRTWRESRGLLSLIPHPSALTHLYSLIVQGWCHLSARVCEHPALPEYANFLAACG